VSYHFFPEEYGSKDAGKDAERCKRTLFDHLLDGARWVDLHGVEVFKAVDFRRFFGELLTKCIGEVVCGVGRLCARSRCARTRDSQ
jgi:hypothetical protein